MLPAWGIPLRRPFLLSHSIPHRLPDDRIYPRLVLPWKLWVIGPQGLQELELPHNASLITHEEQANAPRRQFPEARVVPGFLNPLTVCHPTTDNVWCTRLPWIHFTNVSLDRTPRSIGVLDVGKVIRRLARDLLEDDRGTIFEASHD